MKILSLDQASKITGYAVFDDDKLVKYGKIDLRIGRASCRERV